MLTRQQRAAVVVAVLAGCSSAHPSHVPARTTTCGTAGHVVQGRVAGYADRPYLLATPRDGGRGKPLVVGLHGSGGSPQSLDAVSKLLERGPAAGVSVVLPTAADHIWHNFSISDQPYLDDVLEAALRTSCGDPGAVVLTGFSNGGDEAQTMGCVQARRWRAVVVVSSSTTPGFCRAGGPAVSLLRVHGLLDHVSPFEGREGADPRDPVLPATAQWAAYDGCRGAPQRAASEWRWIGCRDGSGVLLMALPKGGHAWPGRPDVTSMVLALARGTPLSRLG